uniref:NADH-ubiquinone oxidoreductase chain 3 n=1 Tax=Tubulipora flabellaris TaxID=365325 RepID=F6GPI9_9BILA|nr:NADH dehydrogenase subunit 3 [Tubulipora flabellaris]ACB12460.1 NADH dehydrogenase subunit 3 [Tubulipora flabellaris]
MVFIFLSSIILSILLIIGKLLSIKNSDQGTDPFECGFSPVSSAHKPFSLHFFLLGMVFIVFDLEIVLLLPLVQSFSYLGWVFCLILMVGLVYEWYLGSLSWL